jgi:lysozyme
MNYTRLKKMIRKHEGYRQRLYTDSVGKQTIGIGHNIDDLGLHPEVIDLQFNYDIDDAVEDCYRLMSNFDDLPEDKQIVLVDMMFNLGLVRLSGFVKMLQAISDQSWERAANEMEDSLWAKQVGTRATTLIEMMRG